MANEIKYKNIAVANFTITSAIAAPTSAIAAPGNCIYFGISIYITDIIVCSSFANSENKSDINWNNKYAKYNYRTGKKDLIEIKKVVENKEII